jgi:hypothetical protein
MSSNQRPRLVETLISWMAPQVMVFLGKVMNPVTGKTERDLPSARMLIDLLAELEEKTEGRLEDGEKRLLQKTLTELRLNYLDESARPEPATESADAEVHPDDVETPGPDPDSRSSERPVEG